MSFKLTRQEVKAYHDYAKYMDEKLSKVGTCPACNGTTKVNDHPCQNCGGQRTHGVPTGYVRLRTDGTPCLHEYVRQTTSSKTFKRYVCAHCGDQYSIDSGD